MSTFHRVYASFKNPQKPVTDQANRYHGFRTNGELPRIPNERKTEGALVASQVSRRNDNSGLWTRKPTRIANVLTATQWSSTKAQYAMSESQNPIDKIGPTNTHEVGVLGAVIAIESVPRQEMFVGEETGAGTIDEMITRTATGGGNSSK